MAAADAGVILVRLIGGEHASLNTLCCMTPYFKTYILNDKTLCFVKAQGKYTQPFDKNRFLPILGQLNGVITIKQLFNLYL